MLELFFSVCSEAIVWCETSCKTTNSFNISVCVQMEKKQK